MRVSKHITMAEATKSQTATRLGISNIPDAFELEAMKLLANKVFEPVRQHFGFPIAVTSFYRNKKVNKAIGGATNSQHTTGEAMDIDADVFGKLTNKNIFDFIKNNLDFDQLIAEGWDDKTKDYQWIHVSYSKVKNRKQILRAIFRKGQKTIYENYK